MDIFAHGLWAGAAYRALNKKRAERNQKKFSVGWAVFWGVFPDLFAFGLPFAIIFWNIFMGNLQMSDFPKPNNTEPPTATSLMVLNLASNLYNISHSMIIFALVFAAVLFILKRGPWELCGWALHILIDLPTHTYKFFPTPIFWPISGWKFNGISWGEPWFMAINYISIIAVYILLKYYPRK